MINGRKKSWGKIKTLPFLWSILFFFGVTIPLHAQPASQASGQVIYHQELTLRVRATKVDTLTFNRQKSVFYWNLYNPQIKELQRLADKYGGSPQDYNDGRYITGQATLVDIKADSIHSLMNYRHIRRTLYMREPMPQIHWNITDSTKIIGNYSVQKATAHFRSRSYTAWFTLKIPVPYGPWKLQGLPGLILQAYDQSGKIYFSATNITLKKVGSIGPIPGAKEAQHITFDNYKKIMNNFRKLAKQNLMKETRKNTSQEEMQQMTFRLAETYLMETFGGKNSYMR